MNGDRFDSDVDRSDITRCGGFRARAGDADCLPNLRMLRVLRLEIQLDTGG